MIKRFLTVFLPLSILMSGIALVFYYTDLGTERTILEANEKNNVNIQKKIITGNFTSVVSDLMILSEQHELQRILENSRDHTIKDLADNFLTFSKRKGLYDQIRYLDKTGMEIVRVNFNNGKPYLVPEDQLQFKGDRYYFKDTFQLKRGEIFLSPFDLNIEGGEIEQPLKPMIRFGTPVFDRHGKKQGIVVLNYLGENLINDLKKVSVNFQGHTMLVNSSGYWLYGMNPDDNWGFMYKERIDRTFEKAFPYVWQQIFNTESGQITNEKGLFTFVTIYPLLEGWKSSTGSGKAFDPSAYSIEAKKYYWKIISHIEPDVLYAESRKLLGRLFILYTVLFVLLAISSWSLAHLSGKTVKLGNKILSPFNILVTTAILIFLSELFMMLILHYLTPVSPVVEGLIDATLLIVLVSPTLYFLLFRPLIQHIEERKSLENKLRIMSVTDELTGLSNRRGFFGFTQQQIKIANRMKRGMLLFFADLDNLKSINDTLGHHEGDQALKETAIILKETFRESDIIARIGGDEFAVLIVDTSDTNENIITTRLQENLKAFSTRGNCSYNLSLSIGIVLYDPEHGCSIDELLSQADKLMYEHKQSKQKQGNA